MAKHLLFCTICGADVERDKITHPVSCFQCKQKRRRQYRRHHGYDTCACGSRKAKTSKQCRACFKKRSCRNCGNEPRKGSDLCRDCALRRRHWYVCPKCYAEKARKIRSAIIVCCEKMEYRGDFFLA